MYEFSLWHPWKSFTSTWTMFSSRLTSVSTLFFAEWLFSPEYGSSNRAWQPSQWVPTNHRSSCRYLRMCSHTVSNKFQNIFPKASRLLSFWWCNSSCYHRIYYRKKSDEFFPSSCYDVSFLVCHCTISTSICTLITFFLVFANLFNFELLLVNPF
jgi:hypothetical protein